MTGRSSVFQLGILNWRKRCGLVVWSLFTACKEIWVQGYPAADISAVVELPPAPLKHRKAVGHVASAHRVFSTKPTWAADFKQSCSAAKGQRTFVFKWLSLRGVRKPLPFLSVTPPLLAALCSLSSHWHQHKYYPNQRRKFFLNLDDKDILEIYGNDFLWNWIQT